MLGRTHVEARAVVGDGKQQSSRLLPDAYRDVRVRSVLARVLKRFETAEVDSGFDVAVVTPDPLGRQLDVERAPVDHWAKCPGEAAVDQERWVDPMRELAQLLDRVLDGGSQLVEHLDRRLRVLQQDVLGQAQVDRQGYQVLLGAIVQVPLDTTALCVATGHDSSP